jgi:HlyD family secretion protein
LIALPGKIPEQVCSKEYFMRFPTLLFAAAVLAGAGVYFYLHGCDGQTEQLHGIYESNGRTELKRIDVAALYGGRVEEYLVREGDTVAKGQVIARLKDTQTKGKVENFRAALAASQSALKASGEQLARIDSEIRALGEKVRLAKIELENARKLRRDNLIGQTELERRISAFNQYTANLDTAKSSLQEAKWNVQRNSHLVEQYTAQLDMAVDADRDMVIKSPIDGYVEYTLADPGNVVASGGRIAALLDPLDLTLDLFVPSQKAANLRIGDDARIVIDGLDAVIPATISFIATDAQFTPKFVETAEERAKLMFKVTLRISPDLLRDHKRAFNGGMPALGYVRFDPKASWPAFLSVRIPDYL